MSLLIIGYNQEQGDKVMTTINTADDFIRLLRENPEFLAAARRELLTEELQPVRAKHRSQIGVLRKGTAAP